MQRAFESARESTNPNVVQEALAYSLTGLCPVENMDCLIELKADVNAPCKRFVAFGRSWQLPLEYAAYRLNVPAVERLIECKADPTMKADSGETIRSKFLAHTNKWPVFPGLEPQQDPSTFADKIAKIRELLSVDPAPPPPPAPMASVPVPPTA